MLHFAHNALVTAYDHDTIAAYTAEIGPQEHLTVFFDIDYERETVRSVIQLGREHDDYMTTDTRDWPTIEAVLPRLYWPTDIHRTARGTHPQLAEFERQAHKFAREHFATIRAEEALYADDAD